MISFRYLYRNCRTVFCVDTKIYPKLFYEYNNIQTPDLTDLGYKLVNVFRFSLLTKETNHVR